MRIVPIGLKGNRILQLFGVILEQKDSPTAFDLARMIRRKVPILKIDQSTGKVDQVKVNRLAEDDVTEIFFPLKTSDRNYLWGKIKAGKGFTEPNCNDGEYIAFWATTLGQTKDPAYLDFRKKYGLDKKDEEDDLEDDAPDPDKPKVEKPEAAK